MQAKTLRAKPVEVQAVRWDGSRERGQRIIEWIRENGGTAKFAFEAIMVVSEDREKYVEPGQWVILKEKGSFKIMSDSDKKSKWEEV